MLLSLKVRHRSRVVLELAKKKKNPHCPFSIMQSWLTQGAKYFSISTVHPEKVSIDQRDRRMSPASPERELL